MWNTKSGLQVTYNSYKNSALKKLCLIVAHSISAEGKRYNILVKHEGNPITLYCGQPWNWMNKIVTVKLELNGRLGIMIKPSQYNIYIFLMSNMLNFLQAVD